MPSTPAILEAKKKHAQKKRLQGRCGRCANKTNNGKKTCGSCLLAIAKDRITNPTAKRRYDARKSAGLCVRCGDQTIDCRTLCGGCLEYLSSEARKLPKYKTLLKSAKNRASKGGLLFDLDDAWITKKLEIGRCELTNLPFSKDVSSPFGASVDRVKAGGDYTKDNCRVVIRAINTALSNWGEEVLKVVSQAYLARAA